MFSVKFSMVCPWVVKLYVFLGLSLFIFHWLLTRPFFSNAASSGYMVLGPK